MPFCRAARSAKLFRARIGAANDFFFTDQIVKAPAGKALNGLSGRNRVRELSRTVPTAANGGAIKKISPRVPADPGAASQFWRCAPNLADPRER